MISTPHVAKWIYKRQLERERGRRRERVKLLLIKTGRHGTRGGSSDIIRNFRRNIRRNHPDLQAALREIVAGIVYKGKSGGEDVSIANSHLNFQKDLALALLGGSRRDYFLSASACIPSHIIRESPVLTGLITWRSRPNSTKKKKIEMIYLQSRMSRSSEGWASVAWSWSRAGASCPATRWRARKGPTCRRGPWPADPFPRRKQKETQNNFV